MSHFVLYVNLIYVCTMIHVGLRMYMYYCVENFTHDLCVCVDP